MPHSKDFIAGFEAAVAKLGDEGDYRHVDWSAPYKFLQKEVKKLKPYPVGTFAGIKVVADDDVAPGTIEFHHGDGRVDVFHLSLRVIKSHD